MDPILIGTAVSVISYTDFIALVPSRQIFVGRNERNKVGVIDFKHHGENRVKKKNYASVLADV